MGHQLLGQTSNFSFVFYGKDSPLNGYVVQTVFALKI